MLDERLLAGQIRARARVRVSVRVRVRARVRVRIRVRVRVRVRARIRVLDERLLAGQADILPPAAVGLSPWELPSPVRAKPPARAASDQAGAAASVASAGAVGGGATSAWADWCCALGLG